MPDLFDQEETLIIEKTKVTEITKIVEVSSSFLDINSKAKQLSAQVDWAITQRKTEYLEDLLALQKHKSIQIRRKVASGLGLIGSREIVQRLQNWQNEEGDRETWLTLRGVIDKLERGLSDNSLEKSVEILSVSEAIDLVKKILGDQNYTIEGELAEVKVYNQMYYFALKDKQDTRLDCSVFGGKIRNINFPLNDGLTVRILGHFGLNKFSKLKFEVEKIELTGEGELLRNLQLLRQKLELEGLFDSNRKRQIPILPNKILLIASPNSAAIKDFLKVLEQRRGNIVIYHLPIKTQGVGAEFEILTNLEQVNSLTEEYGIDTVVLTRGGGSKDDLFVFNSEKIVRSIFSINRPTIVAIGHEQDLTLSELVADLRASTPSNAAELASTSRQEILAQTRHYSQFFAHFFVQKKQAYLHTTNQLITLIDYTLQRRIEEYRRECKVADRMIFSYLWQIKELLNQVEKWPSSLQLQLGQIRVLKDQFYQNILQKVEQNLQNFKLDFQLLGSQIFLSDPKNILKKGYTITRQNGQVLSSKEHFDTQKKLQLEFVDGVVEV